MLTITLPEKEYFDEATGTFMLLPEEKLLLEHSLDAISKWEAKYKKPYLNHEKTQAEVLYYIRCMTRNEVPNDIYLRLGAKDFKRIQKYIDDPHTATTIKEIPGKSTVAGKKNVTSEEIYYWMTELNIPFSCDLWNFNRLFMLIRVCSEEKAPKKKMPKKDAISNYRSMNAARRAKYHSKG